MMWFSVAVMTAIALLPGEAHYRGPIRREEDPSRYGMTVAGCVLALLVPVLDWVKTSR